jgi:hypothetical protein
MLITARHIHLWLDAWNSHQVARILQLCSEDIILYHPQYSRPLLKLEISACLQGLFLLYPHVHIETDGFLIDGHQVASWEMITGIISSVGSDDKNRLTASYAEKSSTIPAAMRLVYNAEGLIKSIRIYWDTAKITQPPESYPG